MKEMQVLRYEAHNVLRLSDVDLNMEGAHLFIVGGKNGHGKTSVLKGLLMALCGRSGMDWPEVSLKEGENEGWVKVDLGDEGQLGLTVELYLKRRRGGQVAEKFRVLNAEGKEAPEPRALLQRLYNLRAFDPLAFEKMGRKEKLVALKRLVGLDFTDLDKQHKEAYEERTDVNRQVASLKSRLDSMPRHHGVPAEEVSVADLLKEMDAAEEINAANRRERQCVNSLDSAHGDVLLEISKITAEIDRLQEMLASKQAEQTKLAASAAKQRELVSGLQDVDVSAIRQKLSDAEGVNAKVRANRAVEETRKSLRDVESTAAHLTATLEDIDRKKHDALAQAEWPVPGLSIDADGVLYNGLPFEQASLSMRIRTSVKIGMALNPRLKLLVCEFGSDLDQDSLAELQAVLEEGGYQMLLEMVTRGPDDEARCSVIVEDGKLRAPATSR